MNRIVNSFLFLKLNILLLKTNALALIGAVSFLFKLSEALEGNLNKKI
jgi:hypothetical protein